MAKKKCYCDHAKKLTCDYCYSGVVDSYEKRLNKLNKIADKYARAISLMADGVEYQNLPRELK